jgi:hypothetical protein
MGLRKTSLAYKSTSAISCHTRRKSSYEYQIVLDPLETLTYVAANTNKITLGTSVIDMLFHNPVVLARDLQHLTSYQKEDLFVDLVLAGLKMNTKLLISHLKIEEKGQMNLFKY